ncbi:nucleoside triphosphate pyrophosphohydrolase [Risungbinella massiliensis]|uniref:nucleoside triphosphate pyrophosphohydrolase n=1 Tax=Risungbinella massiliensis TaxID=1329796 RepID=UPI0005CBE613|nr:nucleoside triphosphate pyrophosphohydrolase [Risungbinella massiliensis]
MPVYNKLVRDRIPEIIVNSNKEAVFRKLDEKEYLVEARKKLEEELLEYLESENDQDSLEELADLLELIYALAEVHGSSREKLEEIRSEKAEKRGGFQKRLFLSEVKE